MNPQTINRWPTVQEIKNCLQPGMAHVYFWFKRNGSKAMIAEFAIATGFAKNGLDYDYNTVENYLRVWFGDNCPADGYEVRQLPAPDALHGPIICPEF